MYFCRGELAEWSIAAVLKTVECNSSGGSNPSLSAEPALDTSSAGFFVERKNREEKWKNSFMMKKYKLANGDRGNTDDPTEERRLRDNTRTTSYMHIYF